jgi:para-nitrobenzyl esterase
VRAIAMAGPGLIGRGWPVSGGSLAEREAAGAKFATAQGAASLAALRALPATTFIAPEVGKGNATPPVGPFNDGYVLPASAPARQVPVMVGFTADDIGTSGQGFGPPAAATVAAYTEEAGKTYGEHARAFLALYPARTDGEVPAARKAAGRDRARVNMDQWAARQLEASRTVYTYYFDRVTPWPEHPEFGAHHTSEVPYVFGTVGRGKRGWEPVDTAVSERVRAYVVNFARTGNPNGPGLPEWPAFSADAHQTMRLGETPGPMPVADPERRTFHEQQVRR